MITKKAKILIAAGVVGISAAGIGAAQAATTSASKPNFMGNIVSAIAQKFNLNASDVQQVVDQQRAQNQAQMEAQRKAEFTTRINQAVTDGKLTQDQANKITAEAASIKSQIDALSRKTGQDRKTAMAAIMKSVQQWAKDNNIPRQYLMFGFGGPGMGRGMGHGMGPRGWHNPNMTTSPTPTP
jgi:hypothetical protein